MIYEQNHSGRSDSLWDWSIVVFASNEEMRVANCLSAVVNAVGKNIRAHLTVIVNGSFDLTLKSVLDQVEKISITTNVYTIPFPCKWNAMNSFIHEIRPSARSYSFVDATAFVESDLFLSYSRILEERPDIVAVSGLPRNGRSAETMRGVAEKTGGGLGQVFSVRVEFLNDLVRRGRRIPIGLYRGDGLFNGYIVHETDGIIHRVPVNRVTCLPTPGWYIKPLSPFDYRDLKRWYNRLIRQARGRLENQAWNAIIWKQGFDALPRFGDAMILAWLDTHLPRKERFPNSIFTWLALRRVRRWKPPSDVDLLPTRVR